MRAPSSTLRFQEAKKILDYGFSNFSYFNLGNKGDIVKTVNVNKGTEKNVNLILENNVGKLLKKGSSSDVTPEIEINENISAPITKGDTLGHVIYTFPDGSKTEVNLIAEKSIEKNTLWNMTSHLYKLWFNLCRE